MKNLTHGKPLKLILLFAIPLFIGQLFQLFYSLVDTRIVGSILGDEALAAVGATSSLSEMLLSLLNGLTNGFALIIAAFFGADDTKNMKKAVGGTVLLGVISSICISVACLLFLSPILRFIHHSRRASCRHTLQRVRCNPSCHRRLLHAAYFFDYLYLFKYFS